jgi:hypothetical protein
LFANVAGNDYHLKTGSPAINAGTRVSAPYADLAGLPRPAGGSIDIGAYEFGALLGDFSRDGAVSASDFVMWRNTLDSTVTRFAGADGNGNGLIDQADNALWRAHFGGSAAGSGGAIPEPAALVLVAAGLCYAAISRCRLGF